MTTAHPLRVLVVANYYMSYNRRILHGVATYARLHGWKLTQKHAIDRADIVRAIPRADALMLGVSDIESASFLSDCRLPTVGWSANLEKAPWPRVLTDNAAVGRIVAEHFLTAGYRRFAFYPDLPGLWSTQRRDSFVATLQAAGYSVDLMPPPKRRIVDRLAAWLKRLKGPLALMLPYDPAAEAIIAACAKAELRIPEDVAVIGVGNDELVCEITEPPLSSVPQLTERIGYAAAGLLNGLIDKTAKPPPFTLVPPGQLVVRRSSDATAFDDPMVVSAMRFIRDQQSSPIGTKQVVAHIGTSRVTLDGKFVAATGATVAVAIRRQRIEKAKQFLSASDVAMATIARHTGFSCARQFSKTFHHFVGQTPTSYRRQFMVG